MCISSQFPDNYKELVTKLLLKEYGERISIRNTIISPPVEENITIEGREITQFKGKIKLFVVDRRDKDFGMHILNYVIRDQEISLREEKK
jgi:hypothetical protein